MRYLIKQATLLPLLFFIPVFVAGFLVPDYDLIKQHGSEITVTSFETAKLIINTGAILTGLSCIILAFGIIVNFKKYYVLSGLIAVFGVSMVSNGIYPMGTLMHGFYGIGLTLMIIPFIACYELKNEDVKKVFFKISLISGFIIFIYLWSMLVGLDPANYRGLTQRLASLFIFGWLAYLAFQFYKLLPVKD
ncbi:DUF998 domain-containing protein [Winogradskyella sp. DF17]|uniref:DUF998 domain-containing protein n=1 Tax=Winogradskyella pelagia TaxID=2819984 RepID=A0ABS3SX93_9FLAO|nr:DUF998 domain-containing protein [Winogradskyella sp. DF17]MBO3115111.1 DUF998 domain-containing protein [Winogradskyella sp. DF17]